MSTRFLFFWMLEQKLNMNFIYNSKKKPQVRTQNLEGKLEERKHSSTINSKQLCFCFRREKEVEVIQTHLKNLWDKDQFKHTVDKNRITKIRSRNKLRRYGHNTISRARKKTIKRKKHTAIFFVYSLYAKVN